jgi:hypothetical protein
MGCPSCLKLCINKAGQIICKYQRNTRNYVSSHFQVMLGIISKWCNMRKYVQFLRKDLS